VNAVLDLSVKPDTDLAGPVRIRRANGEDADAVRALVFGVLQCYGLRPDPETTDKDLDDLEGHYFSKDGWFAVLEGAVGVIGSYGLMRLDSGSCELRKMFNAPASRLKKSCWGVKSEFLDCPPCWRPVRDLGTLSRIASQPQHTAKQYLEINRYEN